MSNKNQWIAEREKLMVVGWVESPVLLTVKPAC
jgi:hypothetical protein